jgi:hypothetical protein
MHRMPGRGPLTYVRDFLGLIRVNYHTSFHFVVVGAVYSDQPLPADSDAAWRMAKLFFAFNWLLYGGIYAMNGITDYDEASLPALRTRRRRALAPCIDA